MAAHPETLPIATMNSGTGGSGFGEASPREVAQWLRTGEAVLVDVREADEHTREWIEGARLIPLSRFDAQHAAALAGDGKKLVLHCRGGKRSAEAAGIAASLSRPGLSVVSMTGGIEGWKQEQLPVEVNARVARISVMRQVQLAIGFGVLAGSALALFVHPGFVAVPAFFGAGLTFAGASGTCALATLLGKMPWNRAGRGAAACGTGSCASGGACGSSSKNVYSG